MTPQASGEPVTYRAHGLAARRERSDWVVGIVCGLIAGFTTVAITTFFAIMLNDGQVSNALGPLGVLLFVMTVAGLVLLCSRILRPFACGWLIASAATLTALTAVYVLPSYM